MTGEDVYQVTGGDLPSGTTISTQSCAGPESANGAVLFWFGPSSGLNEILFADGSFCPVVDVNPPPILPTAEPAASWRRAISTHLWFLKWGRSFA